ncbi:MAG: LptA/OstA family protein [Thermodesulfovibrionales bacterium]|nr:LptA/OstA family protein [Thermodesulfovibrionales bacterium]
MVNKRFVSIFLIFLLLTCEIHLCFGETNAVKKTPIVITSHKLTSDNKAKIAIFEGDVYAKRGDVHLYADVMKIYYKDDGNETSSKIYKIEAHGNVRLIRGKHILTSKDAVYNAEPIETLVFTGEPRASDGDNVIVGTKMTYYISDDMTVVDDSKVMIVEKSSIMTR